MEAAASEAAEGLLVDDSTSSGAPPSSLSSVLETSGVGSSSSFGLSVDSFGEEGKYLDQ